MVKQRPKIKPNERDKIAILLSSGASVRSIARELGRSHNSILDEIKRNTIDGEYKAIKAQELLDILPVKVRDITIFVCFDGFRILHIPDQVLRVCIGNKVYPVVIEPTNDIRHSGDVRIKYNLG